LEEYRNWQRTRYYLYTWRSGRRAAKLSDSGGQFELPWLLQFAINLATHHD